MSANSIAPDPLQEFIADARRRTGWTRALGVAARLVAEAGHHRLSHQLSLLGFDGDLSQIEDFDARVRAAEESLRRFDLLAENVIPFPNPSEVSDAKEIAQPGR